MQIFNELVSIKKTCLGLGFFDGVHKGHRVLIDELVSVAQKTGSKSCVITFKTSPAEMFIDKVEYLNTAEEKDSLIEKLGVDYLIRLDFDKNLANLSADEYLKNIIYKNFEPEYIFSGFNHTFGKERKGNNDFLRENQTKYGYIYNEIKPVSYKGDIVSSSLIRKMLHGGEIKTANAILGYEYNIEGVVVKGNQLGRKLGFPTANIEYPAKKVQIPFGVYSVQVEVDNILYKGMLNYGIKPTVNDKKNNPVAEVHIIGFNRDIYGDKIKIFINDRIREEKRFSNIEELKAQISEDVSKC